MNLTEKIIRGITEAEFEINPELQKKQKQKNVVIALNTALANNGWTVYESVELEGDNPNHLVVTWEHEGFDETIGVTWDWVKQELVGDTISVIVGSDVDNVQYHPATSDTINKLTAEFKAEKDIEDEIGAKREDFVLDDDLIKKMKEYSWVSVLEDVGADINLFNPIVLMISINHEAAPTKHEIEEVLGELYADSMWSQFSNGFWMYPSYGQGRGDFMNDVAHLLDVLGVWS